MEVPWRSTTIRNVHTHQSIKKAIASLGVAAVVLSLSTPALADTLDDQIRAAQQQANEQQNSASALHQQADNYQQQVDQYNAQIAVVRAQIAVNNAKSAKVQAQITDAQNRMTEQKSILSANIKAMYLDSGVSPLEMLASSKDIGEFFNQQQYQDKVKDKIQAAMAEIVQLKARLDKEQRDLAGLLAAESAQQAQLAQTRSQLASLQATYAQNAAAADQQVKDTNSHIAQLKAQQAAILAAASRSFNGNIPGSSGGSGGACDNGHGNGGYPMSWCNAEQDAYSTPWGYSRECVSWAGWRRQQLGRPVYGWGNANQWDDGARAAGYRVDNTPEVGAVAQTNAGYYGHVAVVEAVQGNNVVVSEMNYDNDGHFRYGSYPVSYFQYIH